jgi:hypothetical protein
MNEYCEQCEVIHRSDECPGKYCDAEEREATYECIGGKKARETLKQIKEGEYE